MATKKTDHKKAKSMKQKLEWVQKWAEEGGGNKGDTDAKREWTEVDTEIEKKVTGRTPTREKKRIKKNTLQRRGNSSEAAECC